MTLFFREFKCTVVYHSTSKDLEKMLLENLEKNKNRCKPYQCYHVELPLDVQVKTSRHSRKVTESPLAHFLSHERVNQRKLPGGSTTGSLAGVQLPLADSR